MSRKIKSIQSEMVLEKLNKMYGGNTAVKKKIILQTNNTATTEQIKELQTLLKDAGLLEKSTAGVYTAISFTEENKDQEALATEQAAILMQQQNLGELAYDKQFKIPTYLYKRIQTKSQQFILIIDAYNKSLPEDSDFIKKCMNNLKENGLDLSSLTYSIHYPFSEEQFEEILSLGLTDAEKINKICGKLLNVDTKLLMDKINNGFFMSRGIPKEPFFKNFQQELQRIGWSFDRLIAERENLDANGIKLDIKIIETAQTQESVSPVNQEETPKPKHPFLGAIQNVAKLKSTIDVSQQSEVQQPPKALNPLLGAIQTGAKLKKPTKSAQQPESQEPSREAVKALLSKSKTKTPPPSPPDLSGKNKITVYTKNTEFLEFISDYLKELFEFTQIELEDKVEFNISRAKTTFHSTKEILEAISTFANEIITKSTAFNELITIEKYSNMFKKTLTIPSLEIKFNPDYDGKRAVFEKILTDLNILFVKTGKKYIIRADCWDDVLMQELKRAKFTKDYFKLNIPEKQNKVNRNLTSNENVIKIRLNLPTKELQDACAELLNTRFATDPEYYLNISRCMLISSNKLEEFQECLNELEEIQGFVGEYIQTDSPEFSTLIEEKFPRRLKISVPIDKDRFKAFFEDETKFTEVQRKFNSCIPGDPTIYYVDFESLTNKKTEFFRIAAETRPDIEYFDQANHRYQPIELAEDSKLGINPTSHSTPVTTLGIFKPQAQQSLEPNKENIPNKPNQ